METCFASRCLWAGAILKSLLCLSAGFSCLFSIWTHSCSVFFTDRQLSPARLLSDLVTADADWRRLNLLTGSRRTSPETQTQIWTWLRQRPHCTPVVHCLQTVLWGPRLLCLALSTNCRKSAATAASRCWAKAEAEAHSPRVSRNHPMGTWRTSRRCHQGLDSQQTEICQCSCRSLRRARSALGTRRSLWCFSNLQ